MEEKIPAELPKPVKLMVSNGSVDCESDFSGDLQRLFNGETIAVLSVWRH